jgi:hypothetical protein
MLATNKCPIAYVNERRRVVLDHLMAFEAHAACCRPNDGVKEKSFRAALGAVEAAFCASLVQSLDHAFVHRTRALEGKDCNPLDEVRMLCAALVTTEGVLVADKTIRYEPDKSVRGIEVGDRVRLSCVTVSRPSSLDGKAGAL